MGEAETPRTNGRHLPTLITAVAIALGGSGAGVGYSNAQQVALEARVDAIANEQAEERKSVAKIDAIDTAVTVLTLEFKHIEEKIDANHDMLTALYELGMKNK